MSAVRWVAGSFCLVFFLYVASLNWAVVWQGIVKRKHSSWVPLVGGLVGVAGLFIVPLDRLHSYWWVPLILDWGCVPGLLHSGWYYALRRGGP